ncbi:hypothetical protein AAVH_05138 [Aphelenchoides avenae]|nr:hypothetical protein AAVH_05138 [Aphelenchus avenae]
MPFGVTRPGRLQLDPEGKARLKKRVNAPKKQQQPTERDLTAAKVLSFLEENSSIGEADTRNYLEFGNELVRLLHQTILTELHSQGLLRSVFDT